MTRQDVAALRIRREELGNQLINVSERRSELAAELADADAAARPGLEQRLAVLDERIVQLERDIAETGRQLTSAPAGLAQTSAAIPGPFGGLDSDQITGISIVFTLFVLFPIAIATARLLWKRATSPPARRSTADSERLERVEHAVETIAIEIERVAEGQRFVTKLLAQPNGMPLTAGAQRPDEGAPVARESGGAGRARESR